MMDLPNSIYIILNELGEIDNVYYNEENKPCGYCDPCMGGEDLSEVMLQVKRFSECLNQPILNAETDFNNKLTDDDEEGKEYE
jgi:hypothetical protein